MSVDNASPEEQDAMAAEWAAALAESKTPVATEVAAPAETVAPASFTNFSPTGLTAAGAGNDLNMILDIPVQLTVELGRTRIPIKHILQLAQGSVVELDALAGEGRGRQRQVRHPADGHRHAQRTHAPPVAHLKPRTPRPCSTAGSRPCSPLRW